MKDTFHATLGMAGESGEIVDLLKKVYAYGKPLDRTKLLEEIGDLMWYVNLFMKNSAQIMGDEDLTFESLIAVVGSSDLVGNEEAEKYFGGRKSERLMLGAASMIAQGASDANAVINMVDCGFCEGEEVSDLGIYGAALQAVNDVTNYTRDLLHALDSSFDEVFEMNIRKLETRYPNLRFEADKAINRDVDAEQKVLQG